LVVAVVDKHQTVILEVQAAALRVMAIVEALELQVKEILVVMAQVFLQVYPLVAVAVQALVVITVFPVKVVTGVVVLLGLTA
jgi:hypothetical protein